MSLNTPQNPQPHEQNTKKSWGWIFKTLFILALISTGLITLVGAGVFYHFSKDLPKIISVEDYRPLTVTRILGDGGKEDAVIGEYYKERRYVIPYDKIPDLLVKSFISAEDDRFFEHQGINLASIIRASIANFRAGHVVQGGSTITQQVAKSLLLTPEKSFTRKAKEVILANRIERNLSKQQILYLYLNQIYLGHGAYGVQAASKTYYNKDVSQITLAEAALLAGMPQAPGKYSPHLNPKRAKERQLYVLRRMLENGYINHTQMAEAAAQPLKIYPDEELSSKYAAYFVEHIRRYLTEKYGDKAVYEEGLTINVPLSPKLALLAKKSVREGLRAVDKRIGYRGPAKHLKTVQEIEQYLKDERLELIKRKIGYEVFLPDGRLDALEAMKLAGLVSDLQLLDAEELYQAVVTSVDDSKKIAGVMIGGVKADLPFEKMKWAKRAKDDRNPNAVYSEPRVPSQILKKGDVVLVKLSQGPTPNSPVQVELEQEPQVQGALVSIEVQSGNILALEGGYDFDKSEFNRAVQAQRQPGSSFKPIIFAAALERGFTPASIIQDSPIVYDDEKFGKWKPDNFESKFYGDTTFRLALIKSRNVPTIKIVQKIQVPFLIEYAKRIGMNAQFNADLSISLGSATLSLLDITKIYSLFPRLGRRVNPVFISSVKDRDGRLLEETKASVLGPPTIAHPNSPQPSPSIVPTLPDGRPAVIIPPYPPSQDPDQLMDPRVAYVMTNLMKEVVNYGTGHEAKSLNRPAAGKTGTTNDFLDAWFMGFTPHVVTGVWVGFDNLKTIGTNETGARAALPIWLSFMKEAVKPYPEADFTVPPGVVFASIDANTGKLTAANSSNAIREAFIEGTEPLAGTKNNKSAEPADSEANFFKEDIE